MSSCLTIDCGYRLPEYAAAFLLMEKGRAAFVENNTTHAVPRLLEALKKAQLSPEDVDYLIITHVHLDHAGGTSALLKACPQATVLAHPRAARHLKDPSKLIAGAKAVYGDAQFDSLYGTIEPIAESRVREMGDGEVLKWGDREWLFFFTRGHANHHFCVYDSKEQASFTGDSFGIQYPCLQKGKRFIFPSTSPTDFDAAEARISIDRIAAMPGDRAFLTHFGEVRGLKEAARDLGEWIDFSEGLVNKARQAPLDARRAMCEVALDIRFRAELRARNLDTPEHWDLLQLDRQLNAAGLAHAASR